MAVTAQRLPGNPILTAADHESVVEHGHRNINGPSLIRVPEWLPNRLGKYYLYFAHHQGTFIRLAYANELSGPWIVHEPGTLRLADTPFAAHIASPDVHVDHEAQRIVMYYHGCCSPSESPFQQPTCVAFSTDGLTFQSETSFLCSSYLRVFTWRGERYGVVMPGDIHRLHDGWSGMSPRLHTIASDLLKDRPDPVTNDNKPRHFAALVCDNSLHLFFSRAGDTPERILHSQIALHTDVTRWMPDTPTSVLMPEHDWEGADCPLTQSRGGAVHTRVRQLRDPAVFCEGERTYLIYSIAGEAGLAIAEISGLD